MGTDNLKDNFLKIYNPDALSQRIPGWFNGTCSIIFDDINIPDIEGKYPFQLIPVCSCYVNCTFKGVTSN